MSKLYNPHFNIATLLLNDTKMAEEYRTARLQDIRPSYIALLVY